MSLLPPTSTPTPAPRNFDRTRSAEIFDLLDGLDADDLEFELDDEPVPAGGGKKETAAEAGPGPSTAARRSTSPSPSLEPGYDAPDPIPTTIPITVSFATARGAALARPSDVAMKRALKIMREAERDVEIDGGDRGKRPRLSLTPPAPEPMLSQSRSHSHAVDAPAPAPAPAPVPAAGQARASGFAMASGTVAPSLSADARARVAALFTDDAPRLPPPASLFASASPTKPSSSGFQTGAGGAAPGLSSAARAQALALFANETPTSSTPPEPNLGSQAPSASPARFRPPLLASHSMSTPVRPSPAFVAPRRTQTPSRMPLYPVENGHAGKAGQAGPSTPAPAGIKLPRGLEIRTPSAGTPRRIGLGIGATPSGKRPRRFATPFKTPASVGPKVGAATATAMSPLAVRTPAYPRQGKPSSASASEVKAERIWKPVFDLEPRPSRISMRDAHLYPGFYTACDLEELGLPDEICVLNLENAIYYQLIAEDASTLGNAEAFARLKHEGCELVTAKWVDNHWSLILWKLAGQVKAKPSLFEEKWNWYEVLCQLKYRYEREYGAAQRPLVRRIQEHDSPASLPMVLCVAGIHHPPPIPNDKDEAVSQRPYLDLTDGWYRIRATTDDCLARAVTRGKIRVGRKLAISGARLESGADGSDVLDAYERSHLVLSGNATHLARWDTRLGTQREPFVAGLTSLSVDGGIIPLMDVVLDKVFPLAFMHGDKSVREPPWSEDEEHVRVDAWKDKYEAETTRLAEAMRANLEKIEDLVSLLTSCAADVDVRSASDPPDSLDSDFDALLSTDPARQLVRVRSFSSNTLMHLASHAARRLERAVADEHAELAANLASACPARDVRAFRVVRIRDARATRREATRTGMLNVWEADNDALRSALTPGRRFLISSVVPGRNGDWTPLVPGVEKDVYLHTRRDTRWKAVGARE